MPPYARLFATIALALAAGASASGQVLAPPIVDLAPPADTKQPAPAAPATKPAPAEPEVPQPSKSELDSLTKRLNSDDFKTRETAQIELSKFASAHPESTLDTLLENYLDSVVPEARYRLRAILYRAKQAEFLKVPRGFVGIVMYPSFARAAGGELINAVQVRSVVPGSAAEKHGLQVMDQIVSIDGRSFGNTDTLNEFADYVTGKATGEQVELSILRNQQPKTILLQLGERPPDLLGQDTRIQERFEADFRNWLEKSSARLRNKE
jgi:C-terminal processing protease CtpA/Prc